MKMHADEKKLRIWKGMVEAELERILPPAGRFPSLLHRAMRYSVLGAGKRLRPLLVFAVGDAVGVPVRKLLPVACAVELVHNFSLVHDDLPAMDDDVLRRGKPTCHKKFGEAAAILAGDALLTLGFEVLSSAGKPGLIVSLAGAIGSEGMAGGQMEDILTQGARMGSGKKRRIDVLKTGRLFLFCFSAPLSFATVPPVQRAAVVRLGADFGLAFQVRDDIEDAEGDRTALERELARLTGRMRRSAAVLGSGSGPISSVIERVYGLFAGVR